jgi:hypothetical protein
MASLHCFQHRHFIGVLEVSLPEFPLQYAGAPSSIASERQAEKS